MLLEWKDMLGTWRFLGCFCPWVNSGIPVPSLNPEISGFHVRASLSLCPDLSTLCQLLIAPPFILTSALVWMMHYMVAPSCHHRWLQSVTFVSL